MGVKNQKIDFDKNRRLHGYYTGVFRQTTPVWGSPASHTCIENNYFLMEVFRQVTESVFSYFELQAVI